MFDIDLDAARQLIAEVDQHGLQPEAGGAGSAALRVGYESTTQFNRKYRRLEQFQQKWEPVLRPKLRLNKRIERFR